MVCETEVSLELLLIAGGGGPEAILELLLGFDLDETGGGSGGGVGEGGSSMPCVPVLVLGSTCIGGSSPSGDKGGEDGL